MSDNTHSERAVTVWALRDRWGNIDLRSVDDDSDLVGGVICLEDAEGEPVSFESEAYHLPTWCERHGISYQKLTVPVFLPEEGWVKP